jgi:FkbM family methyltransferase
MITMIVHQAKARGSSAPNVKVLGSIYYYLIFRTIRKILRTLTAGRGVGALDRLAANFISVDATLVSVQLLEDSVFVIPASDSYWGFYLLDSREYEPELEVVFRSLADIAYFFVDAGANYGYWSTIVTAREFGAQKAVAVEASRRNFRFLKRNSEANGGRYECLQHCIASVSKQTRMFFDARSHAASAVQKGVKKAGSYSVETVSVDDLVQDRPGVGSLVVKLDVEGEEVDAFNGLRRTIREHDTMVLFESHQSDSRSEAVRWCLDENLLVFSVDELGNVVAVDNCRLAEQIKTEVGKGYNFGAINCAHKSSPITSKILRWIERGTVRC